MQEVIKKDVIKVKRSTSLRSLLNLFKGFHSLPLITVVDDKEHLIGVVYFANLLEILKTQEAKFLKNIPFVEIDEDAFDLEPAPSMGELILVDDIMDIDFLSLKEDMVLKEAYSIMRLQDKDQLPVVDEENRLLGIIGIFDIVWRMFQEKGIV